VIELADGTFTGEGNWEISFAGKAVTVRTQSGYVEAFFIDSERTYGVRYRGFDFHSGEGIGSLLEGVTITKG
jgi:hypothetical protein